MKIFVTGATGFVGSAVVAELLGAGHQVLGLARSDESAARLAATGAQVQRGSLDDLAVLTSGAAAADGAIHTAFNHDFSRFAENCEQDRVAIETLGAALEGSDRPLLVTSGVALLAPGRVATEVDAPPPFSEAYPRVSEATALQLAARGVRAATVRLAPSVHGDGDVGFVPALIGIARNSGVAAYIGDGTNRWPAVHRLDVARLFRLAIEQTEAGEVFHGVAEESITLREIAESIGRYLNVPVVSKSPAEAAEHFGWMANFAALDAPASSVLTRERLKWNPTHAGLLADMEAGFYFDN